MYGLFVENGPLQLRKDNTVFLRNATWNQEFAVIYIDNPVGAGFSFTDNDEGWSLVCIILIIQPFHTTRLCGN